MWYLTGGLAKQYPVLPWISDRVNVAGTTTSRVTIITPFLTILLVAALVLLIKRTKIGMEMEGQTEEVPATLYEGEGYSIYIPDEEWTPGEPGEWKAEANSDVKLKVEFFSGKTAEEARTAILAEYDQYGFMSTSGELVRRFLSATYTILRSTETFSSRVNIRVMQCDDQLRSDTALHAAG